MQYHGLSTTHAQKLLKEHGANELEQRGEFSPLKIFFSQFLSPLIYILFFAGLVSVFHGDYVDASIIFGAVCINTFLGFFQEFKAQNALQELSKVLRPESRVLRDGRVVTLATSQLVHGDIIYLEAGDQIPADGLVLEGNACVVNEAILTGESIPVEKFVHTDNHEHATVASPQDADAKYCVYMGTTFLEGKATVRVLATGQQTQVGKIALQLQSTQETETPLQVKLRHLSQKLAMLVMVISAGVFLVGVMNGREFFEMFELSVAIAVSAIPEGLLIALTVILALGMQRILKQKAVVRKLMAAETLGSVTMICTDKTGTLTEGKLSLFTVHTKHKKKMQEVGCLLTSQSDSLEQAVYGWAKKECKIVPKIIDEVPFSSAHGFSLKLTEEELVMVGAPEEVLRHLSPAREAQEAEELLKLVAKKGYRLVGVATRTRRHLEKKIQLKQIGVLEWVGFYVFSDPVRVDVKEALRNIQAAHIGIKVITGDHALTAQAVMEEVGLHLTSDEIVLGKDLQHMQESELTKKIATTKLFARTTPDQKLIIVQLLQRMGHVVAMTGDGVNDAPALKQADIGIVVSSASDVSKGTADIVLLDDNFKTIVGAIEEGRAIYDNLRKVVLYLLSSAFSETFLVLSSLVLGLPLPITAVQVLWINLATDSLPSIALTMEEKEKGLLRQPPRSREESLMDRSILTLMILISGVTGSLVLIVFMRLLPSYDLLHLRTLSFTLVAVMSLVYTFSCRSFTRSIFEMNPLKNAWLLASIIVGFMAQLLVVYHPSFQRIFQTTSLTLQDWLIIFVFSGILIVVIEIAKKYLLKLEKRRVVSKLQKSW